MLKSYMSSKQRTTNGLKLMLGESDSFSQIQASWGFLNKLECDDRWVVSTNKRASKKELEV